MLKESQALLTILTFNDIFILTTHATKLPRVWAVMRIARHVPTPVSKPGNSVSSDYVSPSSLEIIIDEIDRVLKQKVDCCYLKMSLAGGSGNSTSKSVPSP